MRIIKPSSRFKEVQATCTSCKCVFACTAGDVTRRLDDFQWGSGMDDHIVNCPQCRSEVNLGINPFPDALDSDFRK